MKLIIEESKDRIVSQRIQALWEFSQGDIGLVIDKWVTQTQTLHCVTGSSDKDPKENRIYLLFCMGEQEVVVSYITAKEVLESFPHIQPLIPPSIDFEIFQDEFHDAAEEREEFVEKRDEILQARWEDTLCERIFTLSNGILLALAYGLTERAEVIFCTPDVEFCNEIGFEEHATNLLSAIATQASSKTGAMSTENYYIIRSRQTGIPKELNLTIN